MTQWLNEVVAHNVKQTSLQMYFSYLRNQIVPSLGEIKIQDLTPAILDKWIRDLQKNGLSYNTIASVHILIHNALNYAVYPAQLINANPAVYIKVPKNAPKNIIKRTIITPERFKALLEKYPFGTPLYIPFLLLYHTGMRIGKVLGLSWNDIDFESKKINLTRQIVYIRRSGYYFSALKTEGVSGRLGHINSDLTFETYVHDTPKVQEQIFKLQEELVAIFTQVLQIKIK